MQDKELRDMLIKHKEKYGTSLTFIVKGTGICRTSLSLFLNERRSLSAENYKILRKYLMDK